MSFVLRGDIARTIGTDPISLLGLIVTPLVIGAESYLLAVTATGTIAVTARARPQPRFVHAAYA